MKATTTLILSVFFLCSCSSLLCGDLTGEWKNMLQNANTFSEEIKVENIPCEFYYIDVIIDTQAIDTSVIHSLHKYLYDDKSRIGWKVLQVYGPKRQYLFSHKYDNVIFVFKTD